MTNNDIHVNCPNCGHTIDVDDILYQQIENSIKIDYQKKLQSERDSLKEKENKLRSLQEVIVKERDELQKRVKDEVENELSRLMILERQKLKDKLEKEHQDQFALLNDELKNQNEKLKELNLKKAEVERLIREKAQMKEEIELASEIAYNKKLAQESEIISKRERERIELQVKDRDMLIDQLKTQLSEAQRKAEQGSNQLLGESQELAIEDWLQTNFPLDTITEIKKGARGGDCTQIVNTRATPNCGMIYYESKRTKEFQPAWIEKFKMDMQQLGANIGVIVTEALPKDMERMGLKDGVWICSFQEFKGLCQVLRETIIRLSQAVATQENKGDKMVMLYDYLTSNEFKLQIEGIVDAFTKMRSDLESEKRSMNNMWNKRQKQLDKVMMNTIAMHGSIRGIAGNSIQAIRALEFSEDDELNEDF